MGCHPQSSGNLLWIAGVGQLGWTYAKVNNDWVVDGLFTDLVTVQLVYTDATRLHPRTSDNHPCTHNTHSFRVNLSIVQI